MRPAPRSRAQRKADALALLRTEVDCWVASADEMGNAHLVPLSHHWDGAALVFATLRSSPTATNLLRAGVARVGVGPTRDVVLVDGRVTERVDDAIADAHTGFNARTEPAWRARSPHATRGSRSASRAICLEKGVPLASRT